MLRDKFAMAAMQGFCANMGFYSINDDVAERAYQMADAMLRERQNWDFSGDPEQPTGFIVSDTPIKRVPLEQQTDVTAADVWGAAFKHHEATHGKAVPPEEWQPDWSQAPAGYNWWAMDEDGICYFYSYEPYISPGRDIWGDCDFIREGTADSCGSFGYKGDWRKSLRKRPTKPVPPVTETPPLKMEAP